MIKLRFKSTSSKSVFLLNFQYTYFHVILLHVPSRLCHCFPAALLSTVRMVSLRLALDYEAFPILAHINHCTDSKLLQCNDSSLCGFFRASPRCAHRCNYLRDDVPFMWCKLSPPLIHFIFQLDYYQFGCSVELCAESLSAEWITLFNALIDKHEHLIYTSSKWLSVPSGLGESVCPR